MFMFKCEGFDVVEVEDGVVVIEVFIIGDYDLVILDVNMLCMDGIILVGKFCENLKFCVMLILIFMIEVD